MASYVENMLMPNEQVIGVANLHWSIYLRGLWLTTWGGLLGSFSHQIIEWLFGTQTADMFARPLTVVSMVVVVIGTMLLIGAFTRQVATQYVITNHGCILHPAHLGAHPRLWYHLGAWRGRRSLAHLSGRRSAQFLPRPDVRLGALSDASPVSAGFIRYIRAIAQQPDGRMTALRVHPRGEESPGSRKQGCRITSGEGDLRDSATENKPPALSGAGKGEKVR